MHTVVGQLAQKYAPVSFDANVAAAKRAFAMQEATVLPLQRAGKTIGFLHECAIRTSDENAPLLSLAEPIKLVLTSDTAIPKAALQLGASGGEVAMVTHNGFYSGIVTASQFLTELGRSWDPLTGLNFSDVLREWADNNLKAGREVCVIFIDLNDFKIYNKRYGHVVGDRVLKAVANRLKTHVVQDRDVLVRYGGDEFCLGTLLTYEDAVALSDKICSEPIMVDGVPEPVSYTAGVFGGRRSHSRQEVHTPSNIDDLINVASKRALERKEELKRESGTMTLHSAVAYVLGQLGADPSDVREVKLRLRPDGHKYVEAAAMAGGSAAVQVQDSLIGAVKAAVSQALQG